MNHKTGKTMITGRVRFFKKFPENFYLPYRHYKKMDLTTWRGLTPQNTRQNGGREGGYPSSHRGRDPHIGPTPLLLSFTPPHII
jgi:hypothetical protein